MGSSDENMEPAFGSGQGRDNFAFEGDQDSEIMYNAASPDEKALGKTFYIDSIIFFAVKPFNFSLLIELMI